MRKKRIQERSIFQATLTSLYIHRDMNVERYFFRWACFVTFISYGSYVLSIFVAFQENGRRRLKRYVTRQFPSKIMVDLLVSVNGILSTFYSFRTFWVYLWLLNIHYNFICDDPFMQVVRFFSFSMDINETRIEIYRI